jgi:hypothetical protein
VRGNAVIRRMAMYGDDGLRACVLFAKKRIRKQLICLWGVLTPVSVFCPKRRNPDWLSPCGQPGGEVYEDEGDSEDSALGDEP